MGRGRRIGAAVVGVAVAALVVASCSGADHSASPQKFDTVGNQISADSAATASAAGGGSAGGRGDAAALPEGPDVGSQQDRKVVYTGTLTVQVAAAPKAADAARRTADDAGGYLASQRAELTGDRRVVVVLRVPAGSFDEVMASLAKLGDVRARKVDSDDVTDQVVDLRERLDNAKASAARLRELLAEAENINNVIAIEDRLTQRETEIEALTGQIEVLQDQAALSTITATFAEAVEPTVSKDLPGPVAAAHAGGVAFANVAMALVAAVAFLLPFLAVALLVGLVVRAVVRRRRRRADRHPGGPGGPGGPAAPGAPDAPPVAVG
ncbi:MAG: DUF4349 domain-containing protein [Acidimicrobiales bacterium]